MADLTRAMTLWRGGKRVDAEREIEDVLRTSPEEPTALRCLAEIYAASGRAQEAIALWRRLARRNPNDAGVLRQLAQALLAERAFAEAIDVLRTAISLEPANARGYNNLGLAQLRTGDAAGAVTNLEQAVAIDPDYAIGHLNLGLARQQLGRRAAARASYERALQIDPHLSPARVHLSELVRDTDVAMSRRERDRALESHAINLMTVRRHDEAIPVWTQLIESGADIHYLEGTRFHCRLHSCDWSGYAETAARLQADVLNGRCVDLPFSFFVHSNSPGAQLKCSQAFIADRHPSAPHPARLAFAGDIERIKVAYLSFDFHEHATAYLVAGLFECHDRVCFDIIALSYGQNDGSTMRARLERSVERFIDVSRHTDGEVAELMHGLGVHIAVDLKGFTGGARTGIFAQRAAPLQINFLGYPGTMGAEYIDYIVADHHVIPAPDQVHYSEKVITMPQCYQPTDAHRPLPGATSRIDAGLPERGFVFCCFNNLYKITPVVYQTWMALLRNVDESVLWLLEGTPAAMRNLRNAAAAQGISPGRILFAPHIELAQHLARYRHADLFLDTAPCNAHTTASDSLWMGVPLLTVTGQTFAGRVATSLLHAVGLPQLCTRSLEEYAALALQLARTPPLLAHLKAHLERGRLTFQLFDSTAYCRHLETVYQKIWARHAGGESPAPLTVGISPG
jgi:predicted O-linked N-acetylglucosamine transferase (SPINDLY family)